MSESKGLYNKYQVSKTDGSPVDPAADYFVLRLDTDAAARAALACYAEHIYEKNPALADEIWEKLNECEMACPQCGWNPQKHDRHGWNGLCPRCGYQWPGFMDIKLGKKEAGR